MAVEVRPIARDEMLDWLDDDRAWPSTSSRRRPDEVAYRLDVLGQDLGRTLGAVDGATRGRHADQLQRRAHAARRHAPHRRCRRRGHGAAHLPPARPAHAHARPPICAPRATAARRPASSTRPSTRSTAASASGRRPTRRRYTLERAAAAFPRAAEGTLELVDPQRMLEVAPPLFERFRRERPGQIDRSWSRWDARLGVAPRTWSAPEQPLRCVVYTVAVRRQSRATCCTASRARTRAAA